MSDLFSEVDEIMRQERMAKFWKENGNYIILFVVGTILFTGALSGYRAWNHNVKVEQTETLLTLIEAPDFPQNIADTDLNLRPSLRGIALLSAAERFVSEEKTDEALELYTQAANDNSIPGDFRHLAILMRVRLLAAQETIDENLQALLKPIWSDDDSPWRFHARIESAGLYANLEEDYTQSRAMLEPVLQEQNLPQDLRAKAQSLDHVYAAKQKSQTGQDTNQGS